MQISGDWIARPGTQALCAALAGAGYQALFVGGCVRNDLMGLPVADIDLCTDALPQIVSDIAISAGFKVVPTGFEHGTLTIIAGEIVHEVTTFRRDIATDGRHATVAFSTDVVEDAGRRDLTMNALYATAKGAVIDPLGGMPDLVARRVRFVGDGSKRIREDYLRCLRFFRFHALYGDPEAGLDADSLAACADNLEGLSDLSKERVGQEFRKLLSAKNPARSVSAMAKTGILGLFLPGADPQYLAPLVHLEDGRAPDWRRRLVVLGGANVVENLRLSRAEARDMEALRAAISSPDTPAAFGFVLQTELAISAVLAQAAVFESQPSEGWQEEVVRGATTAFPVRAEDLPELVGPALGERLKALQEYWLQINLSATKNALLALDILPPDKNLR
jgi:poly(A) polymerase